MLIRVIYEDGKFDMVKPQMLDKLLEANKVNSFKRNTGWVVIGRDVLRKSSNSNDYKGQDRRLY